MSRTALYRRIVAELPTPWREGESVALRAISADTFDDRVGDNIFDLEDEHAEVDIIAQGMIRSTS